MKIVTGGGLYGFFSWGHVIIAESAVHKRTVVLVVALFAGREAASMQNPCK
jgi:hypothetical protein